MTHFGILCPALSGHLNPMMALAYALKQRGHRLTLASFPDSESKARAAGIEFRAIGSEEYPVGSMSKILAYQGTLSGLKAMRNSSIVFQDITATLLRDAPAAIQAVGAEMLLVDQAAFGGELVPEFLKLPYASICNALPFNLDPSVPPGSTSWAYNPAQWAQLRNDLTYKFIAGLVQPLVKPMNEYRQKWGLPPQTGLYPTYSPYAQIAQVPAEFDFPRHNSPAWFHLTGPFHTVASREPVPFPWERLTGQPLIYASLGTLQNRTWKIFETIAAACANLDAQLVLTLGNNCSESLPELPGNPLVVSYAPQLELLEKATLAITHAGLNTVLECLSRGVPMTAIPIAYDQPGVGARIVRTGTGEAIAPSQLNVPRLRRAIERVLTEESYQKNALALQAAIQRSRGVERAIEVIERVAATGKPVFA